MSNFTGGSARVMVRQIAEGLVPVTDRQLRRLSLGELDELAREIEKLLLALRGSPPQQGDRQMILERGAEIRRLNTCHLMLRTHHHYRRA